MTPRLMRLLPLAAVLAAAPAVRLPAADPPPAGADPAPRLTIRVGTDNARRTPPVRQASTVAFSPDGRRVAAASFDDTARVWDVATGREVLTLRRAGLQVTQLAFSPDGGRIAGATLRRQVVIWDAATGEVVRTLKGHTNIVWGVAFSPDGKVLASVSADHTARLWDPATGKELRALTGHTDRVFGLAFAPDGKTVATGGHDGTVRVWDVATGKEVLVLGDLGLVHAVAFSPDGKRLAANRSKLLMATDVRIWDVASGKELLRLPPPTLSNVWGLAFSPDGGHLAAAASTHREGRPAAGEILVWDTTTGEVAATPAHGEQTVMVAFSPDGEALVSAGKDDTLKVWAVAKLTPSR